MIVTGNELTIIASQLDPGTLHDYLADPNLADAICNRVLHGAHRLKRKLKGPSRRKEKESKETKDRISSPRASLRSDHDHANEVITMARTG